MSGARDTKNVAMLADIAVAILIGESSNGIFSD